MIGMGSPGGAQSEDPVLAVLRVLGDPAAYQEKYESLVKQEECARQALAEAATAARSASDAVIQSTHDSLTLSKDRDAFDHDVAEQKSALALRARAVAERETACQAQEDAIAEREAKFFASTNQFKVELEADRTKLKADHDEQLRAIDTRRDELNRSDETFQKKTAARVAELIEREAAVERLEQAAQSLKLELEGRLARIRAAAL